MENTIQHIDLINNYINKNLSTNEIKNFENRLKTDATLLSLYKEHLIFLEGLKRIDIKQSINKARKRYTRIKGLKRFGYSLTILTIIVIATILLLTIKNNIVQKNMPLNGCILKDIIDLKTKQPDAKVKPLEVLILEDSIPIPTLMLEKPIIKTKPKRRKLSEPTIHKNKLQNKQVSISVIEELEKETTSIYENRFITDNGFMFRDKEYSIENSDIAKESSKELSKWEIDLYCCAASFYDNPNKKSIITSIWLSIKSEDINTLKKGKYIFTNETITQRKSMTFSGTVKLESKQMNIVSGEFELDYNNKEITIVFTFKVNEEESISGKYTGSYKRYNQSKVKM